MSFACSGDNAWNNDKLTHQVALKIAQHSWIFVRTHLKLETRCVLEAKTLISIVIFVYCADGLFKRVKHLSRLAAQKFCQVFIEVKQVLHADPQKVLSLLGIFLELLSENLSKYQNLTCKQKRYSLVSLI